MIRNLINRLKNPTAANEDEGAGGDGVNWTTSIEDLPDEVLDHIFGDLEPVARINIRRVSQRWKLIVEAGHILEFHANNGNFGTIIRSNAQRIHLILDSDIALPRAMNPGQDFQGISARLAYVEFSGSTNPILLFEILKHGTQIQDLSLNLVKSKDLTHQFVENFFQTTNQKYQWLPRLSFLNFYAAPGDPSVAILVEFLARILQNGSLRELSVHAKGWTAIQFLPLDRFVNNVPIIPAHTQHGIPDTLMGFRDVIASNRPTLSSLCFNYGEKEDSSVILNLNPTRQLDFQIRDFLSSNVDPMRTPWGLVLQDSRHLRKIRIARCIPFDLLHFCEHLMADVLHPNSGTLEYLYVQIGHPSLAFEFLAAIGIMMAGPFPGDVLWDLADFARFRRLTTLALHHYPQNHFPDNGLPKLTGFERLPSSLVTFITSACIRSNAPTIQGMTFAHLPNLRKVTLCGCPPFQFGETDMQAITTADLEHLRTAAPNTEFRFELKPAVRR